jgi:outer membrane protein assembly factor BamB
MDFEFSFDDFSAELEDFTIRKTRKFDRMWKVSFGGSICAKPFVHENKVFFGSLDGNVYAVDTKTGQEIWRFFITKSEVIDKTPLVYNNVIYFGGGDGILYALDLNGKELWRFKTNGPIWSQPVIKDDIMYFGSWDCYLYAVSSITKEELWRFGTSSQTQSYIPPAYEAFEAEIKIEKPKEDEKEEKYSFDVFSDQEFFGEHEYTQKSEYKTKSEYK